MLWASGVTEYSLSPAVNAMNAMNAVELLPGPLCLRLSDHGEQLNEVRGGPRPSREQDCSAGAEMIGGKQLLDDSTPQRCPDKYISVKRLCLRCRGHNTDDVVNTTQRRISVAFSTATNHAPSHHGADPGVGRSIGRSSVPRTAPYHSGAQFAAQGDVMTGPTTKPKRPRRAAAYLVLAALIASGCSKTIDSDDLEVQLKDQFETQMPEGGDIEISCPEDIDVEKGTEFRCTLTAEDGSETDVLVMLTDNEGGFEAEVLPVGE